jgi:hypothetical protein
MGSKDFNIWIEYAKFGMPKYRLLFKYAQYHYIFARLNLIRFPSLPITFGVVGYPDGRGTKTGSKIDYGKERKLDLTLHCTCIAQIPRVSS